MLVRDLKENVYHDVLYITKEKRVKTYHCRCGRAFVISPHSLNNADFYERCPECKRLWKANIGVPATRHLPVDENNPILY